AFRPHVAPPVEGGIWDHAHDEYVELAGETGLAGVLAVLAFCIAVMRAARRQRAPAVDDTSLVRWGLAGGVAAILVHGAVEFGLRMPANLALLMALLALLVMSG